MLRVNSATACSGPFFFSNRGHLDIDEGSGSCVDVAVLIVHSQFTARLT